MNKKQTLFHLGIGAPTIFMIFVILVMCILAILAYLQADTYYQSTIRQAKLTEDYYQSESALLKQYYQLDKNNLENSLKEYKINYQKENDIYIIEKSINNDQNLQLSFINEFDGLKIISLKVINQEE